MHESLQPRLNPTFSSPTTSPTSKKSTTQHTTQLPTHLFHSRQVLLSINKPLYHPPNQAVCHLASLTVVLCTSLSSYRPIFPIKYPCAGHGSFWGSHIDSYRVFLVYGCLVLAATKAKQGMSGLGCSHNCHSSQPQQGSPTSTLLHRALCACVIPLFMQRWKCVLTMCTTANANSYNYNFVCYCSRHLADRHVSAHSFMSSPVHARIAHIHYMNSNCFISTRASPIRPPFLHLWPICWRIVPPQFSRPYTFNRNVVTYHILRLNHKCGMPGCRDIFDPYSQQSFLSILASRYHFFAQCFHSSVHFSAKRLRHTPAIARNRLTNYYRHWFIFSSALASRY